MHTNNQIYVMTLTMQSHDVDIDLAAETINELIHSFGFYPANSLIIRWSRLGNAVLTQRCDIDAFLTPEDLSESDLELFLEPGRTYRADQAELVVCQDTMDSRIQTGIDLVESALVESNIDLFRTFIFVGQRVFLRDCSDDCDPHLTRVDTHLSRAVRAAACESNPREFIASSEFRELPPSEKQTPWRVAESQFVHELLQKTNGPATDTELARLVVALGDVRVRDSILWDMANGVFDRDLVAQLLTGVLPKLDSDLGAPVATSAAICWWLKGNGAMANMCLARAFTDAPHYPLAIMIRTALDYALSPDFWVESIKVLTRRECLAGCDVV